MFEVRRLILWAVCWGLLLPTMVAGQPPASPELVLDPDPTPAVGERLSGDADAIYDLGRRSFFVAGGPGIGGVWATDGTLVGTRLVLPGDLDAFGIAGSTLLLVDKSENATSLWTLDADTEVGRVVVRFDEFYTSSRWLGALPERDTSFFWRGHEDGIDAWATDGTPEGTRALGPRTLRSGDTHAAAAGGLLLFDTVEPGGVDGRLFASDGTPEGTREIPRDVEGRSIDEVGEMASLGDVALMIARSGAMVGLYRSDGSEAGTRRLAVLDGAESPEDVQIIEEPDGERVWLVVQRAAPSITVWRSDGTADGTAELDQAPGTVRFAVVAHGDALYLTLEPAGDSSSQLDLWAVAPGSTKLVSLQQPDGPDFQVLQMLTGTPFGSLDTNRFYFIAIGDETGIEPWTSDGTPEGTRLAADLCPGSCSSRVHHVRRVAGRDILRADLVRQPGAARQPEFRLFALGDGGAELLVDLPMPADGFLLEMARTDELVLWVTDDGSGSFRRLWVTDGTGPGTRLLGPVVPYDDHARVEMLGEAVGGAVVRTRVGITESLWLTDGREAGTSLVWSENQSISDWAGSRDAFAFVVVEDSFRDRLWVSDGSPGGTRAGELLPTANTEELTEAGGRLYWRLHPIDLATGELLPPLTEDRSNQPGARIVERDGTLYFFPGGLGSRTLYASDGTPEGTRVLAEGFFPEGRSLTLAGDRVVFFTDFPRDTVTGVDVSTGEVTALELSGSAGGLQSVYPWVATVDGRVFFIQGAVVRVVDREMTRVDALTPPNPGREWPDQLVAAGDRVFFTAWSPAEGRELWCTDGSLEGTRRVLDIAPGPASSDPGRITPLGDGRVVFDAFTLDAGREMWVSDGTAAGTHRLADQGPGTLGSRRVFDPSAPVVIGSRLVYDAWTPDTQEAVWSFALADDATPSPPAGPWLTSARVPGFRFKVRITDQQGGAVTGVREPGCIEETLCVSGALPGRSEIFLRVVGPKPNGFLWPTLAKFTTSQVEVWVERTGGDGGERRYYLLPGATAGGPDVLPALFDRQGFPASTGHGAGKVAGELVRWHDVAALPLEPGEPAIPAGSEGVVSSAVPGFRFHVRLTSQAGDELPTREEAVCIDETVCISGSVPGRSEIFLRVIGPRPNGFLWPTIVRFTTSEVEVWVEQLATGEVRYYRLPAASPGDSGLDGLFDRQGFR
jgi:ELWxxDGT repeat protein